MDVCLITLEQARTKHKFELHAYVVMPDHVHILIGVFGSSVPGVMRDWKRATTLSILKERKSRGPMWQTRYFDFIPRRVRDFWQKMEYIHSNPVVQRLARTPDEWRWSSAGFYSGKRTPPIPVDEPHLPLDADAPLWPMHGKGRM